MFISSCGGHLTELLQLKELINKYNAGFNCNNGDSK